MFGSVVADASINILHGGNNRRGCDMSKDLFTPTPYICGKFLKINGVKKIESKLPINDVSLAYLEGMREALECVTDHGEMSLYQRCRTLWRELGKPTRSTTRNPLRKIQGLEVEKEMKGSDIQVMGREVVSTPCLVKLNVQCMSCHNSIFEIDDSGNHQCVKCNRIWAPIHDKESD